MLITFIVFGFFIVGVVFSEDVKSFLRRCIEKISRFRDSARDEEINNLNSEIKSLKSIISNQTERLSKDRLAMDGLLKENAELKISKDMQSVE